MNSETRNCQNCKNDFTIEPDDFSFYEKIKVPPPTFCPECRFIRRMIWKNERSLHKGKCDICEKNIISMYDDSVIFPVYCSDCYKSDKWEASVYGQNYDFSKPFFIQWGELFNKVPRQALWQVGKCLDSNFSNFVQDVKNVYLSYSIVWGAENVFYSKNLVNSKDVLDSYLDNNGTLLYENINSIKNYNCKYSYWSSNCINCNFILDCNNCQDCFGCVNLQNKRYCILNEQYTKEEYKGKIDKLNLGSFSFIKDFSKEFWDFSLKFPKKYARIINSLNSSGDEIENSINSTHAFSSFSLENTKYVYRSAKAKDSMDICHAYVSFSYEHAFGGSDGSNNLKFIITGTPSTSNLEYCDSCPNSHNLFGCIGIKNKQYCILNKQYKKEEYFKIIEKIRGHMNEIPYVDKKGNIYKYGEFFPIEFCPFAYNESVVNEFFSLSKEEIIEKGYLYKEKIDNKYTITIKAKDIPDNIKDIDDSILDEIIECKVSGKAFKITPFELQFYKRMSIPIPRFHPDERYKKRLTLRNPMILYVRNCMNEGCTNEFETSYSPDRPEIVYCEKCYQQEVY